ncbi:hypothetical protein [Haloferax sp. KTX1]|nr:hypothetical protein [Haloferax sp. KTX1]
MIFTTMHRIGDIGDRGGHSTAGETVEKRGDETAGRNRRDDD